MKKLLEKNNKIISIKCYEFDKYGRLLVELLDNETDVKTYNDILIEEGWLKNMTVKLKMFLFINL